MTIPMISLIKQIKEDLSAHGSDWTRPGFQALAVHRFGNWQKTIKSKVVRAPFHVLTNTLHVFTRNVYGIELPFSAKIGRRVVFEHQHGIVIHGNCTIGSDVTIRQGVTLGIRSKDRLADAPVICNGTDIGAGAKILGYVVVGPNAKIGANAVVLDNVHEDQTVVGIPAKPVGHSPWAKGKQFMSDVHDSIYGEDGPVPYSPAKDHGQQHMGEWQRPMGPSPVDDSLKAPDKCCGCGLEHGPMYPYEPSVRKRPDGKIRCNDCWKLGCRRHA